MAKRSIHSTFPPDGTLLTGSTIVCQDANERCVMDNIRPYRHKYIFIQTFGNEAVPHNRGNDLDQ